MDQVHGNAVHQLTDFIKPEPSEPLRVGAARVVVIPGFYAKTKYPWYA
jgi:hypothetical protein